MSTLFKKQRGFTVIEIMLVLVLVGVITTALLIIVPQAQRNARNSQRVTFINALASRLEIYKTNNNGLLPLPRLAGNDPANFGAPSSKKKDDTSYPKAFYWQYLGCVNNGEVEFTASEFDPENIKCEVDILDPLTGFVYGLSRGYGADLNDDNLAYGHTNIITGTGGDLSDFGSNVKYPGLPQGAYGSISIAGENPDDFKTFDNPGSVNKKDPETLCTVAGKPAPEPGSLYYCTRQRCDGELPEYTGNERQYALAITLEGGAYHCVDNS